MLLRKFSHMHRVPFSILCPQSWKFPTTRSSLTSSRENTHTTSSPARARARPLTSEEQLLLGSVCAGWCRGYIRTNSFDFEEEEAKVALPTLLCLSSRTIAVVPSFACHDIKCSFFLPSLNFSNPQGIGPPFTMRYDRISYLFFVPVGLLKEEK